MEQEQVLVRSLVGWNAIPGRGEGGMLADAEVAEVALLLQSRQVVALERAAHRRGLTVGQLIRCLIRGYLASQGR